MTRERTYPSVLRAYLPFWVAAAVLVAVGVATVLVPDVVPPQETKAVPKAGGPSATTKVSAPTAP